MADETAQTTNAAGITGSAPLYVNPEPLNPTDHGDLGVSMVRHPFIFAAEQHFVPVVAPEFGLAATCYPIVFAGDDRVPLAVMGLKPGENLFFSEGDDLPDVYVPGYVRRYPFTVAADQTSDNMVVCVDRAADIVNDKADAKFFENGQLSEYAKRCVAFCESYERDRVLTNEMIDLLKELDLFESRNVSHTPEGTNEPQIIASFFAISEERMSALPLEQYARLRYVMGAIYAHMVSLLNWERLIHRAYSREVRKAAETAEVAGKPN